MILDKRQKTEEDIKLQFITPAIVDKWTLSRITMETRITDGQVNLKGNFVVRSQPKKADYVLYLSPGKPIAVVEAKDNTHSVSYGLQQAITYARMMDVPFAYSSNGDAFQEHDLLTGLERTLPMDAFPTVEELSSRWACESNGGRGISPDEKKIVCTISRLADAARENHITKTALILVGDAIEPSRYEKSRLYAADFSTEFRKASE